MGGRKSYSIKKIIRKDPSVRAKKASLTKALKNENVEGITRSLVNLVSDHRDIVKIFSYSGKLSNRILKEIKPEEVKTIKQILPNVKRVWSSLKREQKLDSNKVIDDAVVYAVAKFLREKRE